MYTWWLLELGTRNHGSYRPQCGLDQARSVRNEALGLGHGAERSLVLSQCLRLVTSVPVGVETR